MNHKLNPPKKLRKIDRFAATLSTQFTLNKQVRTMKKRGLIILSFFLLLSIGTTCYFIFAGEKEDPNLAPLKEVVKKIPQQNLTPKQMIATHQEIREKAKNLSKEAKADLRQTGRKVFMQIINQRMDRYFNAPSEQKNKVLDQQIREMDAFIKQLQAMRPKKSQKSGGKSSGGDGPGSAKRDGPGERNAQSGSERGGWGRKPPANQEEREQRRKALLDRTSPKDRARFIEYITAIRDRRKELGLPEMPFGRR